MWPPDLAVTLNLKDPLQQLLLEMPGGRLQTFPVAWNTAEKRWMEVPPPDVPLSELAPEDWLHWTGAAYNAVLLVEALIKDYL